MSSKISTTKNSAVSADAYSVVVDAARMRNIRLIKSEFVMSSDGTHPNPKWKSGFGCEVADSSFDAERGLLTGHIIAEAYCKVARKKVVSLRCNYVVAYDVQGKPEESAALSFVQRVGTFAAYPYFRAHFADVTSQAGLMLPPLPVLKETRRIVPETTPLDQSPKKAGAAKRLK